VKLMQSNQHGARIELDIFELGLLNNCLHFAIENLRSEEDFERYVGSSRAEAKALLEQLHLGFEA
jgi:hypothetical protein